MEETGQDALEMAKEEDEEEKESPEDEKAVNTLISFTQGVWGSPVSLRAPVITDGCDLLAAYELFLLLTKG